MADGESGQPHFFKKAQEGGQERVLNVIKRDCSEALLRGRKTETWHSLIKPREGK